MGRQSTGELDNRRPDAAHQLDAVARRQHTAVADRHFEKEVLTETNWEPEEEFKSAKLESWQCSQSGFTTVGRYR
jgi:hypothetical protein